MSLHQKVSSAIRILRWNRDVSARASHLVEVIHNFQAGSGNVSGSTFSERKIMSTKTSFKRIALVAAAALTLGGLSAVSAHAVDGYLPTVDLASAPATATVGTPVTAVVHLSGVANQYGGNLSATAFIVAEPSTSALPYNAPAGDTYTATAYTSTAGTGAFTFPAPSFYNVAEFTPTTLPGVNATARENWYYNLTFTPDAPGSYSVVVFSNLDNTQKATWTVVAAAKAPITAASSTAYIAATNSSANAASDLVAVAHPKTLNGSQAAHVLIHTDNATANATAGTITAVVTGPGLASFTSYAAAGRAVSMASANNNADLLLFADGVAGVSTVNIYSGTTLIATKTVTYYGTVASFTASAVKISQGDSAASHPSNTGAIQVIAKDSLGNLVPGAPVKVAAADKTVVVSGTGTAATAAQITAGTGAVDVSVAGGKYGKIDLTVSSTDPSITATATVTLTVSSLVAKTVTLSADASSYTTGSLITLTESAVDANGLPVADGGARAALSSNLLVQFADPTLFRDGLTSGSFTGGKFTVKAFAPVNQGTLTFTDTAVAPAAIAAPLSVEITNQAADSAQAAIDAAQEATDAANAAYDAANNAMDSADAATAAAQDASDNASAALAAVTSLSATVAKLVASVQAIATALASIKKKLGVK